jgi:hypothetical protein
MPSENPENELVCSISVKNSRNKQIAFVLEPWAESFDMPPGARFEVLGRGPQGGKLEVIIEETYIAVWPWRNATLSAFHNGIELGEPREPFFK